MSNLDTQTNRESLHPGKKPICIEMLLEYIQLLGYSKESFRDALEEFRNGEKRALTGPSERSWREILKTGLASDDFHASTLKFIRTALQEAYAEGTLTAAQAPMVVHLDRWPDAFREVKAGMNVGFGILTKADCYAELCRIIKASRAWEPLYAAVGVGVGLNGLLDALGSERPKIRQIVVRRLSDAYLGQLVPLGLVPVAFADHLKANVKRLQERSYPDGTIPVAVHHWKKMAPCHGVMYGDVIFCGAWQWGRAGINTTDAGMCRLTPEHGRRFKEYRDLIVKGE